MWQGNVTWLNRMTIFIQSPDSLLKQSPASQGLEPTQHPDPWSGTYEFWRQTNKMASSIGSPIIMIGGTIGNILTVLVLRRMSSDTSTFPLFFMALAVSDLALLYVGLLPFWVHYQFDYSVRNSFQVSCKLLTWLNYSFGLLSAWLLMTMAIQRAVSVVWPHKVRSFFTKRQAYVAISALVLTMFMVTSNLLYALEIHPKSGFCTYTDSYTAKFLHVWMWIDFLMGRILPFIVLLLSNTVLIGKVLQSVRSAKQSLAGDRGADQVATREKKLSSMTVTLVVVSVTFILLTSPIAIVLLVAVALNIGQKSPAAMIKYPYMEFLVTFTNMLWYTNSAINFFLYVLTGTHFRQELKALLGLTPRDRRNEKYC